jgi:hypothetical protein
LAAQHPAHAARFSQCIHAPAAGKNKNLFDLSAHATNLFHGALARAVRRSQKSSKLDVR